jgi:guanylate kinase
MLDRKHSRIVLAGKAASGKDYLRKRLIARGFVYGISYTSRPPRPTETDGIDYHFISRERFEELISEGYFYEYVEFNGWLYGTANYQWYGSCDVFIMTPHGISKIKPEDRSGTFIIHVDIPLEVRRERLGQRNDNNDQTERRLAADERDFEGFVDFDIRITDPNF